MSDRYQSLIHTPAGQLLAKNLGLPNPVRLERHRGEPLVDGTVVVGGEGRLGKSIEVALRPRRRPRRRPRATSSRRWSSTPPASPPGAALVELQQFFTPLMRSLRTCPRVVVLGTPRSRCTAPMVAQRRSRASPASLGKEIGRGGTRKAVRRPRGGRRDHSTSASSRSRPTCPARSSGSAPTAPPRPRSRTGTSPDGKVTGASRGIGEQIARVLHRDGATILGIDVPQAASELQAVDHRARATTSPSTSPARTPCSASPSTSRRSSGVSTSSCTTPASRDEAGQHEAGRLRLHHRGQLTAPERITTELPPEADQRQRPDRRRRVDRGHRRNVGQTNYASKAGVIGLVDSPADDLKDGITVNAVAPGFIETKMTAAVPFATREVGPAQRPAAGRQPVDVAETIAWYANPGSTAVNGNVVRVCGQMMLGA